MRIAFALTLAACGGSGITSPDLATAADLSTATDGSIDLGAMSPIGGPCVSNSDCIEGAAPVCFRHTLFNRTGYLATPGGLCSTKCTSDADCGAAGVCVDESTSGKWCYATCGTAVDCRSPGYACVTYAPGPHCWPSGNLTCDPTSGDGSCTTQAGGPGGCIRNAIGAGLTGYCQDACTPGVGSCAPQSGSQRQCVVFDERGIRDPAASSNDVWVGGNCIYDYATNLAGQECRYTTSTGTVQDSLSACADGLECYRVTAFAGGDNKCHPLCIEGAADGGVDCRPPSTCHDLWRLFGSAKPWGLCF